ncbi:MAG: pirin family protein [Polyangiaceae bacterium]|nr:pirin family protein [Polyangiaceae bacterium]
MTTRRAGERSIEGVHASPGLHWVGDGFRVAGYFSAIPGAMRRLSPFLLLDYHPPYVYSPSDRPRGVGVHPHRGFETVTLAWEGSVAHHDSTGAGGVIGPGDAQWMTAASGILHKEYHEREWARGGGRFHMAQLWVNLPRAHKMGPPRYQGLTAAEMGRVELADGAVRVRVIAGEHAGVRGPALTFSDVTLLDARVRAGGELTLAVPASHNLCLLLMSGEAVIGGERASEGDLLVTRNDGDQLVVRATEDAHALVMGGAPIDEPIAAMGPFVMSTERELREAVADYEAGRFGHLDLRRATPRDGRRGRRRARRPRASASPSAPR